VLGGAKGDVTFCRDKDTSGDKTAAIKAFSSALARLGVLALQDCARCSCRRVGVAHVA
jgi:hypothetical protein